MTNSEKRTRDVPEALQAVLSEQEGCWKNGQPILAEELIQRHPHIREIPDAILELVYNEAILREQLGQSVDIEQFQSRFPDLATKLSMQWEVDRALVTQRTDPGATLAYTQQGPLPTRSQVGRYRIDRLLGTGGMGIVYLAWDPALNRTLALKMLRGSSNTEEAVARFRTETMAIAQLQHPHLVQVFDVGECDGEPFYAMEYCAGGTLANRLKAGPMASMEAANVLVQIGRGVMAAHEHRILHRDLKPGNIIFTSGDAKLADTVNSLENKPTPTSKPTSSASSSNAVAKVADFGLAKDLSSDAGQTQSGAILGTPNYMPPEQAFGQLKNLQPTADVYSLGAILYECLTGRPPFQGATVADTLNQVREQEPVAVRQLQPTVPKDLETICLKCLQKEPTRRYQSAADFVDDLVRFQEGKNILARPTGAIERAWRWAKRNPNIAALSGTLALLLVVAAIGATLFSISLNSALGEAKRDRDRVAESERKTRETLAASHATAALLALQRGNGRVAIEQLDAATAAGLDTPKLHFQRVKALCAVHELSAAGAEIRTLAARPDLGELTAEVLLWQADIELDSHSVELDAGLKKIRAALDRGLPLADQHYARGLLAKSVPEALEHFQQAVQADPINPRTNSQLAMLLLLSGRFRDAREQLIASQLLFPEQPVFDLIHAVIDAVNDQPQSVKARMAILRERLGPQPYKMAEGTIQFCQDLAAFCQDLEKLQCGDPSVNRFTMGIWFTQAVFKAQTVAKQGSKDLYLPFPPGLFHAFQQLAKGGTANMNALMIGGFQAKAVVYEQLAELQPDGFYYLLAGTQRAAIGTVEEWQAASRLLQKAANARSFLPTRRMSLYGAAVAESNLFCDGPASEREGHRTKSLELISTMMEGEILGEQGFKISGHCERLNAPPELMWRVLAVWERAAPQDSRLADFRATCMLRTKTTKPANSADEKAGVKPAKPN